MATAAEPESFEARVTRRAQDFDLGQLLDVLRSHGYGDEEILFQSPTEGVSGHSLIASVEFRHAPVRTVVVTVNMGLLGDNTLLPSYFLDAIHSSRDPERFYDFIRFFDHRLISNMVRALYPEKGGGAYKDFDSVERSFLRMLGLGSVGTLQWLAQLQFPELRVHVARRAFSNQTVSHAFRTGVTALDGTGVLGRVYEADASGFVLDIYAQEETDARGRGWAAIVRDRLRRQLFPILDPFRIPLVIRLRVLFHASWVRLDFPAADEHGYLGYERIRGQPEDGHTLVLYRGVTGEAQLCD